MGDVKEDAQTDGHADASNAVQPSPFSFSHMQAIRNDPGPSSPFPTLGKQALNPNI